MHKKYLNIVFLMSILPLLLEANALIDCRVITNLTTQCNPYGEKLLYAHKMSKHQFILLKSPHKDKIKMKVVAIEEAQEEHIKSKKFIVLDEKTTTKKVFSLNISEYGYYCVVSGDVLSKIAQRFDVRVKDLVALNRLENKSSLQIGQKLKIPYKQYMIDARTTGKYRVKDGDTLLSIAKMFKLSAKDIVSFNKIKDANTIHQGTVLKLPFGDVLKKQKPIKVAAKTSKVSSKLSLTAFGKHKLRVTATAYTSHGNQTDDTPFLAAWNNKLRPGMKIIAVSRDLLSRYGMRNGTKVRIAGLRGFYRVRDKMNKRYKKRIDIYMGLNLRRALKWGKRSVVIYW